MAVRLRGANGEIPALMNGISNPLLEAGSGTMLGRRFDWGGRLPKSNGGARRSPHPGWESGRRTFSVGQFDWGGLLPKSNGGVQRSPQPVWQSGIERNGRRRLDCETYKSSRDESRA